MFNRPTSRLVLAIKRDREADRITVLYCMRCKR